MYTVAVIIGSLRKDSMNLKLVNALNQLNHPNLTFNVLDISDLPLYNQDNEAALPAPVARLKASIESADAVLVATPEYNRSIPGVLKNALDWGSRPYGKNSFAHKPSAIIGASPGNVGTAAAQAHLRSILITLETTLLGQPEVYFTYKDGMMDANHQLTNADTAKFLQGFLDAFSRWIETHQALDV